MAIFFPFPFFLLLFGLEPQRFEERKKKSKLENSWYLSFSLFLLCPFRRQTRFRPHFIYEVLMSPPKRQSL